MTDEEAIRQANQFREFFARVDFSDEAAVAAFQQKGEMVTMKGARRTPDHFVVSFASETGIVGPFCLNRATAERLHQLLGQEGFSS
jgi:hypothetical protein